LFCNTSILFRPTAPLLPLVKPREGCSGRSKSTGPKSFKDCPNAGDPISRTPNQIELTAGKTREELLLATATHIDAERPTYKADLDKIEKMEIAEAATAIPKKTAEVLETEIWCGPYRR
jgi:hypothetical protein